MRAVVLAVVLQMTTVIGTCTIDNDLTTWIETEVDADDHKAFCHCVGAAANFFNYDQAYAICNVGDPPEQSSCGTNKGCPAPHLIDQNKMTFAQCEAQCSRLVARIPRDGADLAFVYNINDNELCLEDYPEIWVASEQTVNNDLGGEEQAEEYKAFCSCVASDRTSALAICNSGDPPEQSSCTTIQNSCAVRLEKDKTTYAQCEAECNSYGNGMRVPADSADAAAVYRRKCRAEYEEIWIASSSCAALSPPAPPPAATGKVARDPHVNFAYGGSADFRGRHGALYNFLSAPGISVNVKTEEALSSW